MQIYSTAARWVATVLTVALWVIGSIILIRAEQQSPHSDWIIIWTIPVVWASVIVLPVIAHHAARERQWFAAAMCIIAAVVGSGYTLSGTISRQSEARDTKVAGAELSKFVIVDKTNALKEARKQLSRVQDKVASEIDGRPDKDGRRTAETGCGSDCVDWKRREAEIQAQISILTAEIKRLGPLNTAGAGEKRTAALIAMLPGVTAAASEIEPAVALFGPSLLGIFIEFAALALAFYAGFPAGSTRATLVKSVPLSLASAEERAVTAALVRAGRPVTNGELAKLMRVSKGEASKRVTTLDGRVSKTRTGREVRISLN